MLAYKKPSITQLEKMTKKLKEKFNKPCCFEVSVWENLCRPRIKYGIYIGDLHNFTSEKWSEVSAYYNKIIE